MPLSKLTEGRLLPFFLRSATFWGEDSSILYRAQSLYAAEETCLFLSATTSSLHSSYPANWATNVTILPARDILFHPCQLSLARSQGGKSTKAKRQNLPDLVQELCMW